MGAPDIREGRGERPFGGGGRGHNALPLLAEVWFCDIVVGRRRRPTQQHLTEGAVLPWKIQKVVQPEGGLLATCRYADLSKLLPDPSKGGKWVQNESSREWSLVPCACTSTTVDGDNAASTPSEATDGVRHHQVLPTDTFQGICLRYKLTLTELR